MTEKLSSDRLQNPTHALKQGMCGGCAPFPPSGWSSWTSVK
jgi:hypothetical protein